MSPATEATFAAGSFRDPQGRVIIHGDRVYRALFAPLAPFPGTWSLQGPLAGLFASRQVWPAVPVPADSVPESVASLAPGALGFLEHPPLAPITFPYEWPFELLKRAALLHLDIQLHALEQGLTLSDGSAFNVQFSGSRPVFIDALAFMPYVEGAPWAGYSQFCESFLNPLLLASRGSDTWHDVYRGRVTGVSTRETARELGAWGALRAGVFTHVTVNAMADGRAGRSDAARVPKLSRAGLVLLLRSLRKACARLRLPEPRGGWAEYGACAHYSSAEKKRKHAVLREWVARIRPACMLDIGCNTGEYAEAALAAGAGRVVGLERDPFAVNRAVLRADTLSERFLPLQVDITNPSPALGWDLAERAALRDRLHCDASICLAVLHHLVFGAGVPLSQVVRGVVGLAPRGLIEFVPPSDPMAQRVRGLATRLVHPYDLPTFLAELSAVASIGEQWPLTGTGRVLVEFTRTA